MDEVTVWDNFDSISISFLLLVNIHTDKRHIKIVLKKSTKKLKAMLKNVDWSQLSKYEEQDFALEHKNWPMAMVVVSGGHLTSNQMH